MYNDESEMMTLIRDIKEKQSIRKYNRRFKLTRIQKDKERQELYQWLKKRLKESA